MKIQLLVHYPTNWTGNPTPVLDSINGARKTLLELQLDKLGHLGLCVVVCLRKMEESSQAEECRERILKICSDYQVETVELETGVSEPGLVSQFFKSRPECEHYLKLVAEDFLAPSSYALQCYREIVDESHEDLDFAFSVNETPGTEFEIYFRNITGKLEEMKNESPYLLKYRIAKLENRGFHRKRFRRKFINEFVPNFRFTADSQDPLGFLGEFLQASGITALQSIEQADLEEFSIGKKCFLRSFPNQFYDHRNDFGAEVEVPIKMQFLERGLICKRYMKPGHKVLDLCSGDMYLPQICYRKSGCSIHCIDNSETSRKLYEEKGLSDFDIQLHPYSILSDEGWARIRELGPFDVVTFTAAIEHFTEEEQDFLAKNIRDVLKPGGVLAGDTIIVPKQSLPGHWQHKKEFEDEEDLASVFEPYFSDVDVFVSHYESLVDQPVYFVCKA